ncbi:hypothetical protein [Winogradskyella forsetii]|uniref:hypothetical protein n=2 Tax=Winogradskyella forsetii TaxID=2686077 RepID=UPI0015BAB29D|nr:hypothetical protein [Winogradskyella forsetii]
MYSQQRTLVFNNEGRIIKNYGYDSHSKIKDNIDFLIENPQKNCTYYLLYDWRNEYNHIGNILENRKLHIGKFDDDGTLIITDNSKVKVPNERYMNFILLKANIKGTEKLTDINKIALNEILLPQEIALSDQDIVTLFPIWENLKENQEKKGTKLRTAQAILNQNKEIEKLEKQIEVIKLALDKLGMLDEAQETPNKIMELQTKLNDFELELIDEKSNKSIDEAAQKTFDDAIDNNIQKAERQIASMLSKVQQNSLAYYNLLHQGVLISKNNYIKEIVYDVYNGKLFDSKRELLSVARLTPNLPQLTTDSELYCHIINLKPDDLEKNPFIISMKAELSEPVEVESPSNIRALQSSDMGLSETFPNPETAFLDSDDIRKDIDALEKILESLSKTNVLNDNQKLILTGYIGKLKEPFKTDFTKKFKKLEGSDDIQEWKLLIQDIKNKLVIIEDLKKRFELKKPKFIEGLKKYLPKSNYTPVSYSEYILKYPRPFEAKRKPTIELLAKQFKTENYIEKVDKGKFEKASYDIKYEQVTLIEDELPPVHRLFRFSVNAGVLLTNSISYNYEQVPLANSNVSDLKEVKETSMDFRPSITFSTYLWKQDLAVNIPINRFYETTHIDVSIDYDDSKILDNIYLGVGIEPLRNIQLAVGARFGQVDRLKPENFDPLMALSDQKLSSEIDIGYYVSLSLGFDLIPKFYNLIVNK